MCHGGRLFSPLLHVPFLQRISSTGELTLLVCSNVFSMNFVKVWQSFYVSVERYAVALSSGSIPCWTLSNHLYAQPFSLDLHLVDYDVCGLCNTACIAFQFPVWTISRTEYAPAYWENLDQQIIDISTDHLRLKAGCALSECWTHWLVHLLPFSVVFSILATCMHFATV